MEKNFTGCLPDTRPTEEKIKDWKKDPAMALPLNWQVKGFDDVKPFPVRDQDGSGSCVAQSLALILGIENFLEEGKFLELSARDIYTRRSNQGAGMIGTEALQIAKEYGATLEIMIPSQKMGEQEINKIDRKGSDLEVAEIFKIKDYWQIPFNLDSIATVMENGRKDGVAKPLMVWFQFPRAEWDSKPDKTDSTFDYVHHSVVAREYGILGGKRGIFIQDSWGLHSSTVGGLRFISEEYLTRMTFCAYVNDQANNWQDQVKPNPITKVLKFGMRDPMVQILQELLRLKGYFKGESTTYFGTITLAGVKGFQRAVGLNADGIVGPATVTKLLE